MCLACAGREAGTQQQPPQEAEDSDDGRPAGEARMARQSRNSISCSAVMQLGDASCLSTSICLHKCCLVSVLVYLYWMLLARSAAFLGVESSFSMLVCLTGMRTADGRCNIQLSTKHCCRDTNRHASGYRIIKLPSRTTQTLPMVGKAESPASCCAVQYHTFRHVPL
jgi:hypothetical protein